MKSQNVGMECTTRKTVNGETDCELPSCQLFREEVTIEAEEVEAVVEGEDVEGAEEIGPRMIQKRWMSRSGNKKSWIMQRQEKGRGWMLKVEDG